MTPDRHDIPFIGDFYTKEEVDGLVKAAVDEAKEIDRLSMAKHNRDATIISMIIGFTCLALFVDGLLRILGIIPPFLDLDVNVIDDIVDKVEGDLIPQLSKYYSKINEVDIANLYTCLCYTKRPI